MTLRLCFAMLLMTTLFFGASTAAQTDSNIQMALDAYLNAHYQNKDFMGEVLIADTDNIIAHSMVGMADIESQRPHAANDIYHVASLTKQFTGAAIAVLISRGQLSLDSTLGELLPDFAAGISGAADISVLQLARHEAGIADYNNFPDYARMSRSAVTLDEVLAWIDQHVSQTEPGDYRYSNSHYAILARIIEQVSGMSYTDFMQQTLFEPTGMHHSGHFRAEDIVPGRVAGYDPGHGLSLVNAPALDNSMKLGSGSLHTSAFDLLNWHRALQRHDVLDENTQALYLNPSSYGYAMGISVSTDSSTSETVVHHDGKSPGAAAWFKRWPESGKVLIVLSNVNTGVLNQMKTDLSDLVHGKPIDPPASRQLRALDNHLAEAALGTYQFPPATRIQITRSRDGLTLHWGDGGLPQHLIPLADSDWFLMGSRGDRIRFVINDQGEVGELEYDWGAGIECCSRLSKAN
jgi:CubicO group peptidase (beta-lactamase class C family)